MSRRWIPEPYTHTRAAADAGERMARRMTLRAATCPLMNRAVLAGSGKIIARQLDRIGRIELRVHPVHGGINVRRREYALEKLCHRRCP